MAFGDDERLTEREKALVRVKSLSNYVMGILLLAAGCFFMFPIDATRPYLENYDSLVIKIFAVICWVYGLFRIYRGYKKNYFRES